MQGLALEPVLLALELVPLAQEPGLPVLERLPVLVQELALQLLPPVRKPFL